MKVDGSGEGRIKPLRPMSDKPLRERAMKKHTCSRCRKVEQIPTHQLVRFDAAFHDLCQDCWQGFRSWFYAGDRVTLLADAPTTPATES